MNPNWNRPLIEVLSGVFDFDGIREDGYDFLRDVSSENIMDGNTNDALMQIKSLIYSTFSSVDLPTYDLHTVRFYNIEKDDVLDKILETITQRQIGVGPVNFNDVHDPLITVFASQMKNTAKNHFRKKWYKQLIEACRNLRITCLCPATIDGFCGLNKKHAVHNELMWAHYANCHSGICVEYDIKKESFDSINQSQKESLCFVSRVDYSDKVLSLSKATMHDALLKKSKMWSYEHEHRIIYFDCECEHQYMLMPATIKAVYLGVAINNKKTQKIIKQLKPQGVPVFRMIFNEKDLLNLRYVQK